MRVEHSGEGIYGCRSHNVKLFERIEAIEVPGKVENVNKLTMLLKGGGPRGVMVKALDYGIMVSNYLIPYDSLVG